MKFQNLVASNSHYSNKVIPDHERIEKRITNTVIYSEDHKTMKFMNTFIEGDKKSTLDEAA